MRRLLTLILVVMALALPVAAQSYSGAIKLDSVAVVPGNAFSMAITLSNNSVDIAGLQLPIKWTSSLLTLDSISFVGSLLTSNFEGFAQVDNVSRTAKIAYVPSNYTSPIPSISASTGTIARLWFHLASGATPQILGVDSINQVTNFVLNGQTKQFWTRVEIADNQGTTIFLPTYQAGKVQVLVATALGDNEDLLPTEFTLSQNYPNPFNPSTTIAFALPKNSQVNLEVYNVLGQKVVTLLDQKMSAGQHEVVFDAGNQPSGIYFYRLVYDGGSDTRKMILLK